MKRKFTETEVRELIFGCPIKDEVCDKRRWVEGMRSIVEEDGKYYELFWNRGLTETQEDEFWEQEANEVELVETIDVIKEWKIKE